MSAAVAAILGTGTVEVTVPDAGHSVMLDQPLALTTAIAALVGAWGAPRPRTSPATHLEHDDA
jgi:pimeloyl-ACP methyl ester carboxylesterase